MLDWTWEILHLLQQLQVRLVVRHIRACRRTQSNEASSDRVVTESVSIQCSASTSPRHKGGPVRYPAQQSVGPLCEPLSRSEGPSGGGPVNPLGVLGRPVRLPSSPNPLPRAEEDSGGVGSSDPDGDSILAQTELVPRPARTVSYACCQTAPDLLSTRAR
jgi:hypothetical protein